MEKYVDRMAGDMEMTRPVLQSLLAGLHALIVKNERERAEQGLDVRRMDEKEYSDRFQAAFASRAAAG